jgi:hypothetical protein
MFRIRNISISGSLIPVNPSVPEPLLGEVGRRSHWYALSGWIFSVAKRQRQASDRTPTITVVFLDEFTGIGLNPIPDPTFSFSPPFREEPAVALSLLKGLRDTEKDPLDRGFASLQGDSLTSSHGVTLRGSLVAPQLP